MKHKQAEKIINTILFTHSLSYERGQAIYKRCIEAADILNKSELITMVMQCCGEY